MMTAFVKSMKNAPTIGTMRNANGERPVRSVTAFMMASAAAVERSRRIPLEVGAGSGYAAAVLSRLVADVHGVELLPELAEQARRSLSLSSSPPLPRARRFWDGWLAQKASAARPACWIGPPGRSIRAASWRWGVRTCCWG